MYEISSRSARSSKGTRSFRKVSIRPSIGGHPALTAVAEYTDNSQKMAESLTWIATEHTTALFFARMPAHDLEVFQVRFDQIIYSASPPWPLAQFRRSRRPSPACRKTIS